MNSLLGKPPIGDNLMRKRICTLVKDANYNVKVQETLLATYDYMRHVNRYGLAGGCHALSSVIYVIFAELGLDPEILVGECQKAGAAPFDHSWVSVEGKIVDLAIYMPLQGVIGSVTGPVIFGTDALTMEKADIVYGINTGLPMDRQTALAIELPLTTYMDNYPYEPSGLWTVVKGVAPSGIDLDTHSLKEKYSHTMRHFIR